MILHDSHITCVVVHLILPPYSKRSRFEQQHVLQSLTLTSYFYKNIYRKVIYLYFYESIFQNKSIHMIFVF